MNNVAFINNTASSGSSILIYHSDELDLQIKEFKNISI